MKNITLIICILFVFLLSTTDTTAQNLSAPNGISAKALFMDHYSLITADSSQYKKITNGLELGYNRAISNWLTFGIPVKFGLIQFQDDPNKKIFSAIDFILRVQYYSPDAILNPYFYGGGGVVNEDLKTTNIQFPLGLGLNIKISKNEYLTFTGEYRRSLADNRDNLQYGVGVLLLLGKAAPKIADKDNDGVPDNEDLCPDKAGVFAFKGCPDRDNDGIPDKDDKCPDVAGTVANMGCPEAKDTDGDGIMDDQDDCPDKAGPSITKGCPDKDGDGIVDKYDKCPDVFGTKERDGCPEPEAVVVKDTDGDGIPDSEDKCPTVVGAKENNGCPLNYDTDGDGVPDRLDKCPDVVGPKSNNGCPVEAVVAKDSDGDGVPDSEDKCPDVPGTKANNGCPVAIDLNKDSDGDGVPDKDDKCPALPGSVANKGCPDSDGDGIADFEDECPTLPGTKEFKGCPDSDGDGISDRYDKCPYAPGPKANSGCPEIKEEVKQVLKRATQAVRFKSGTAVLEADSYKTLNEVVRILNENPEYNIEIAGHTDNKGTSEKNTIISENRAKSCYEYLIAQGIDPKRLKYKGYGKTRPIASNDTEEGRAQNRRTEFNVYFK